MRYDQNCAFANTTLSNNMFAHFSCVWVMEPCKNDGYTRPVIRICVPNFAPLQSNIVLPASVLSSNEDPDRPAGQHSWRRVKTRPTPVTAFRFHCGEEEAFTKSPPNPVGKMIERESIRLLFIRVVDQNDWSVVCSGEGRDSGYQLFERRVSSTLTSIRNVCLAITCPNIVRPLSRRFSSPNFTQTGQYSDIAHDWSSVMDKGNMRWIP